MVRTQHLLAPKSAATCTLMCILVAASPNPPWPQLLLPLQRDDGPIVVVAPLPWLWLVSGLLSLSLLRRYCPAIELWLIVVPTIEPLIEGSSM